MQHVDYIAVRKLQSHSGRRARRSGSRIILCVFCGRTDSLYRRKLGALRVALSGNHGRAGKHKRYDAEKPMHSPLLLDGGA